HLLEQLEDWDIYIFGTHNCTNGNTDIDYEADEYNIRTCVLIWSNGDKYIGDWTGGNKTGYGVMTWSNGDKYVGDWLNDKETGKGTFTWSNGDKYTMRYS
ncbi:unnamed protein product, partial [Rotaria magnacalcarata]